jgi:hypothetical protein
MRRVTDAFVCLMLALGALAAVLYVSPGLGGAVGLDFRDLPAALDKISQESEREGRLDGVLEVTDRRIAAKDEVTRDLIAGRLRLIEAAGRFRALDADASEGYREGWHRLAEGASDEVRYCRQVLNYVALLLKDRPDGGAPLRGRLEAELRHHLKRGDLHLPDE